MAEGWPLTVKSDAKRSSIQELSFARFLAEAQCRACGKNLESDSERVLVIPMMLNYHMDQGDWGNHKIVPYMPDSATTHYCLACIHGIERFSMSNPWCLSAENSSEEAAWIEAQEKTRVESVENDEGLKRALAGGDMRKFDAAIPTSASRDDVMARATPVSKVAARIAKRMDGEPSEAEIEDQLFASDDGWKKVDAAQSAVSGVDAQRAKVLDYLNSPHSRGASLPRPGYA